MIKTIRQSFLKIDEYNKLLILKCKDTDNGEIGFRICRVKKQYFVDKKDILVEEWIDNQGQSIDIPKKKVKQFFKQLLGIIE